ncbi:Pentatricopeptide repeat-containing protein, mitochondrial [Vitis vinifera]|uniref:Pentatricopeptide repeat-containing protein, mitochondrial n=1 Tax=Vitis vinifera TaxID=29760 RepID=A0A438EAR8_VITVI|nr:Pentatricopeptide repeat-containing protein, mitochondrial [Vitis vinifera]
MSHIFSHFPVKSDHSSQTLRFFSSFLQGHSHHCVIDSTELRNFSVPRSRSFSSELALEDKGLDHVVFTDIFSKPKGFDEIKNEVESSDIVVSHELVLKVLENLESNPEVARRVFDWVLRAESERLSSKSYNLMLGILGSNGLVSEFWDLVEVMKKKGYGVSKAAYVKALENFEKEALGSDLEKLRGLFASGSVDNSIQKICSRVSKIIRSEVWGDNVEGQLHNLKVTFSGDLVAMVLENLGLEPMKALIFFRWVEESDLIKHDKKTYNAMLRVLGREDCIERFWKVADEMRNAGYEMEVATYVKVVGRFYKRKMINEVVDLYEFAMSGANKPSMYDCTFLLRKIVVSKVLDISLFSRVVRTYTEGGNILTKSMLDAVLKSLTSVGRFGECNKLLKAMEEGGYVVGSGMQNKIAFGLSSARKTDEANEFMNNMEDSDCRPNYRTWSSLIEGYCVAGDLDKASDCFQKMVEKEEVSYSGYAFEVLVNAYCCKGRSVDACGLLCDLASKEKFKPWHSTYKLLISKLLVQGGFQAALNLLGLMKDHEFPPFLDPFIEYVSRTGTGDDAITFLRAMTVKRFPSTSVFLRTFEAFFKAGRHNEAQDFLSICPGYIRNHADVLNLFYTMKSGEAAMAA